MHRLDIEELPQTVELDVSSCLIQPYRVENKSSSYTDKQVEAWPKITRALSRPETYSVEIEKLVQSYRTNRTLTQKAINTLFRDISHYEMTLVDILKWHQVSIDEGVHPQYLKYIKTVEQNFKTGQPLSNGAIVSMKKKIKKDVKLNHI